MMNRLLIGAVLMAGLVSSALGAEDSEIGADPAQAARIDAPPQRQPSSTRLTFMDSKLFDAKLAKELDSGVEIVNVAISGRISLNSIPPRMDKWIVRCAETGSVEFVPIEGPQARFFFALVSLLFSAMPFLKDMREEMMYDKIKDYDAKLYYRRGESGDSLIERIVLTRRTAK